MSVSQPNAMAFLQAIPKCADTLIPSEMFDLIIQRQMGLPLSCSGGVRWSKSMQRDISEFGHEYVNRQSKGQWRHDQVVKAWAKVWKAAFPGAHIPVDDGKYNEYSKQAKPDLTAKWASWTKHH